MCDFEEVNLSSPFYVQLRLRGYVKGYAEWVKTRVHKEAKRLRIRNLLKASHVSHVTLFGPARTNHLGDVLRDIEKTSKEFTLVPFEFGGFDGFLNQDAIYMYFSINPSDKLIELRHRLAQNLLNSHKFVSNTCTPFDKSLKFKFHSTLGKFPPKEKEKFKKLLEYAKSTCSLEEYKKYKATFWEKLLYLINSLFTGEQEASQRIILHLLRVTILGRRSHILCEYDLVLKRRLNSREALSRYWSRRTYEKFQSIRNNLRGN